MSKRDYDLWDSGYIETFGRWDVFYRPSRGYYAKDGAGVSTVLIPNLPDLLIAINEYDNTNKED